ncbi:MAG: glycosyltransferase [Chitinophagaceae bacterium]|nr:glycosyltransferase [Chitinophagaceae bacterium]
MPAFTSRIRHLPPFPATDMPRLSADEKQAVRDRYTEGKNYFLVTGPFHAQSNIITLLKAFSRFKKRQKTEWKLVLAGPVDASYPQFSTSLASYKYRADVLLYDQATDEEQQLLMAAAYALILPADQQVEHIALARAWAAGIPQLLPAAPESEIWAKDAALYVDIAQHEAISDQLMRLYKDEDSYKRLSQAAGQRHQEYQWPAVTEWFNSLFIELHRPSPDSGG